MINHPIEQSQKTDFTARVGDKLHPLRCAPHVMITQTTKDRKFLHSSMVLRIISLGDPLIQPLMWSF